MNILMVLTSHAELGDTGRKTGFWLEEFAAPYYVFKDAGADVTVASPRGGQPPLDPKSDAADAQTDDTRRFKADLAAMDVLAHTARLADVDPHAFDAVFYPGGHGPLWDLVADTASIALIEDMLAAKKPLAFVCHGPAALRWPKRDDGRSVVAGKRVTGFTNGEEQAVGLTNVVPFLLEDTLPAIGGVYSKGADFTPYVVTDDGLVTGQNPASSGPAAKALLQLLDLAAKGAGKAG